MKRLHEIVLFFCLTIGLMTTVTAEYNPNSIRRWKSLLEINHDTTGFIHILEVDSFNLAIIPPSSGVQFYKDGIVFLSLSKNEVKMLPQHISFGAIEAYYATLGDSILKKHMVFSSSFIFSYPCEAITFSHDFSTMYFTKFPKKENKEKIYLANFTTKGKKRSGWLSEIIPMEFCTDNFTYTHPALSVEGDILIFASDRKGSFGGMDLFITRKVGDKWSPPENLGRLINTSGNELYPSLDSDNNLYFSSDGLSGYGGYDVFTSKFNGEGWDKPINLSRLINSVEDDIAFSINKKDGQTAFFTRRQKSEKSNMQLFKVSLDKKGGDISQLTISYLFHGKPQMKRSLAATLKVPRVSPVEFESAMTGSKIGIIQNKTGIITPAKIDSLVSIPENKTAAETEQKAEPSEAKVVIIKPTIPTPVEQKDVVIYRIQFLSSIKPQRDNQIILNGESYRTYEYFYLGEYRYTIGEFTTLAPAVELQNTCRHSEYPHAFVAAFKNNTRSLDVKLFK